MVEQRRQQGGGAAVVDRCVDQQVQVGVVRWREPVVLQSEVADLRVVEQALRELKPSMSWLLQPAWNGALAACRRSTRACDGRLAQEAVQGITLQDHETWV